MFFFKASFDFNIAKEIEKEWAPKLQEIQDLYSQDFEVAFYILLII